MADPSDDFEMVGNPLTDASSCDSKGDDEFHNIPDEQETPVLAGTPVAVETAASAVPVVEKANNVSVNETQACLPLPITNVKVENQAMTRQPSSSADVMPEPLAVVPAHTADAKETPEDDILLREEWSQSVCHMQDIRYAQQDAPAVPHRKIEQQLKVLVCGQAETGKTMLIRNLFASYTKDHAWTPVDVSGLSASDFAADPTKFQTVIDGKADVSGNLAMTYMIQEAPALEGSSEVCVDMLVKYIRRQQAEYLQQEQDFSTSRADIVDGRVDVCLYALPTNVRVSSFDLAIMQELSAVVPTVAIMCKADCMTVVEVNERRKEMRKLIQEGLNLYEFPADVVAGLDGYTVSDKLSPPPFIIMVGNESDESVHPFWFVRKYRWGTCEAYREVDSDLKWLRQLLLEKGFWSLKDTAESLFRSQAAVIKDLCLNDELKGSCEKAVPVEKRHDSVHSYGSSSSTPTQAAPDSPPRVSDGNVTGLCDTESWFEPLQSAASDEHIQGAAKATAANDAVGTKRDPITDFEFNEDDYHMVEVQDVLRTNHGNTYRLTLNIPAVKKVLCMRIGASEGACLLNAMRDIEASRPCTYDSWMDMIQSSGGLVVRAIISNCADTVFYARIHSLAPSAVALGDKAIDIDVRPSDAFNIALRCKAPIYLRKDVAEQYAKYPSKPHSAGMDARF